MNKTVELVVSLSPNEGWWITAYNGQCCNGSLNNLPFASKTDAMLYAERKVRKYRKLGFETCISESRNSLLPRK